MPGRSNIYCYTSPIPVSLCCMSPFLTFSCIHVTMEQIILTLQFCKIYDNQMASILGFLAVGKKWFIKVLFFPLLNWVVASLFLTGLIDFCRKQSHMVGGHCIHLQEILKLLFVRNVLSSLTIKTKTSLICVLIGVLWHTFPGEMLNTCPFTLERNSSTDQSRYIEVQHGESMSFME